MTARTRYVPLDNLFPALSVPSQSIIYGVPADLPGRTLNDKSDTFLPDISKTSIRGVSSIHADVSLLHPDSSGDSGVEPKNILQVELKGYSIYTAYCCINCIT